jgi:hypothetical protein
MNKAFAILFACLLVCLFGIIVVMTATGPIRPGGAFDLRTFVVLMAAQVVFLVGFLWYCGFAALHSVQYLASPQDRSAWLLMIVGFNIAGACYYFLTVYQSFREEGKGRLMSFKVRK